MDEVRHCSLTELEAGLAVLAPPKERGSIELIVRRPAIGERELLSEAQLDPQSGLVGDNWATRGSSRTPDRSAHPEMQLTLMNAHVIALMAQEKERWALAGDQLFVDFDLSAANLPPGTRLQLGSAIIEITAQAHTGCAKFAARFGHDALRFVNLPTQKELRLRGVYARVIQAGLVKTGDVIVKL